jgi:hypothetical protein
MRVLSAWLCPHCLLAAAPPERVRRPLFLASLLSAARLGRVHCACSSWRRTLRTSPGSTRLQGMEQWQSETRPTAQSHTNSSSVVLFDSFSPSNLSNLSNFSQVRICRDVMDCVLYVPNPSLFAISLAAGHVPRHERSRRACPGQRSAATGAQPGTAAGLSEGA